MRPTSEFIREEQEWIFTDGKERDINDNGDFVRYSFAGGLSGKFEGGGRGTI